ncbi:hypothetical protein [Marinactinospora rubrisoli]|uniref:HEAT repeat domain-containing protein n=1 Tax=Marinactinospora rubrisoli TaxID=2715399 RepID=A0ABW2KNU0_9ACTN
MQLFLTRPIHWEGHRLADPKLEAAHDVLRNPAHDAAYPERDQAFLALLRSGHVPAVAIALDHYHHAEALTRHGPSSPYGAHDDEVRERARELLARPPFPAEDQAEDVGGFRFRVSAGASHASAMWALMHVVEASDAELIAGALEISDDPETRQAGLWAAESALAGAEPPDRRLMDVLRAIAGDERAEKDERGNALDAIGAAPGTEAVAVVVGFTEHADPWIRLKAGEVLAHRHLATHRELVQRLADSWDVRGGEPGRRLEYLRERLAAPADADLLAVVRDRGAGGEDRAEALSELSRRDGSGDVHLPGVTLEVVARARMIAARSSVTPEDVLQAIAESREARERSFPE